MGVENAVKGWVFGVFCSGGGGGIDLGVVVRWGEVDFGGGDADYGAFCLTIISLSRVGSKGGKIDREEEKGK